MKVARGELGALAKEVLQKVPQQKNVAVIIALQGELGAGKTTFVQALARELGVADIVQSPTYVLMKSYPIHWGRFKKLIHIDAYRLETPEQFKQLKPETFLNDPTNLIVVEWPEKLEGFLPEPDLAIKFSSEGMGESERNIEVQ